MRKILPSLFVFFMFTCMTLAEVPNEIRYNGRLKSYQTLVNGTAQMNFKLYENETGGTALWESGNKNINVTSGIFTYTMLPNIDWRKKDIWLQLVVNGIELVPREKIMTQAYALHSNSAENLSSNSEIKVQVSTKTVSVGVNSSGELYSKSGNIEFYMVPKGGIILWSGSVTNIPSGWALCDGTNGTPDLKGRFVLGQGTIRENNVDYTYSVNQKGGEVNHKLTVAEMPSHSHYLFTSQLKREGSEIISSKNSLVRYADVGGARQVEYVMRASDDGSSADSGKSSMLGGDSHHNNMPPYYALCYIMKK
ncbi:MAG: hypothetical protein LBD46_01615 [Endomicrobium sp.]|jgi:microcystin-dependent protein|nr:hypothetical protein [Endomicrobium sp.]